MSLIVWSTPPPLTVTPPSLTFLVPMGGGATAHTLTVQSTSAALPVSMLAPAGLSVSPTSLVAPASLSVGIRDLSPDSYAGPGEYHSSFQILSAGTTDHRSSDRPGYADRAAGDWLRR